MYYRRKQIDMFTIIGSLTGRLLTTLFIFREAEYQLAVSIANMNILRTISINKNSNHYWYLLYMLFIEINTVLSRYLYPFPGILSQLIRLFIKPHVEIYRKLSDNQIFENPSIFLPIAWKICHFSDPVVSYLQLYCTKDKKSASYLCS